MSKFKGFLTKHSESLFIVLTALPLYCALFVLLLVLGLPAFCLQFVVNKFAKYFHPDWVGLMRGKDVIVGADNIKKPRNVLLWYNTLDANVTLQEILRNFSENIVERRVSGSSELMYPKYKQYFEPWLGYNFWKWDSQFDIRNHIKLLPGSSELTVTTEEQVMSCLGQLISAPFTSKHPYWECFCVPNYLPSRESSAQRKTMIIYRMHHGIGDGYSFLKCFMQHLCNDDLNKMVKLKEPERKREGLLYKSLRMGWAITQIPYLLLRQCIIDIDHNEWFVPMGQLTGECHVAQTHQISIPAIKEICKEFNVSFTSVLFAALAGGINKHFKRKYFPSRNRKIPNVMRCFTPFPWRNHPNNKLINHWTCASVPLFPSIDSAQERMEVTERYLDELKRSPIPLANHLLLPIGATFPVWAVKFGNWFNTMIVSNFPGPTQHVKYYKRYTVDDLNFWAPHLNGKAGVGVTMISYGQVIRIGLNFDKAILPCQQDVDDLCFFVGQEFEKLFKKKITEGELSTGRIPKKLIPGEGILNNSQQRQNTKLLRHRSVS